MGRGRAKAKQTKVARDLKYRSHETDFGALARELHGDQGSDQSPDEDEQSLDGTESADEDFGPWDDYGASSR